MKLSQFFKKIAGYTVIITAGVFLFAPIAQAYRIEEIDVSPNNNDFVLGPGKTELILDPGETTSRELLISNRLGRRMEFQVSIEDFSGGEDPKDVVVLLGDKRGPYSLKDFLHPELSEFELESGERMVMPVTISIPADAEPGNLLGAVLLRTSPPKQELEQGGVASQVKIESQLGTLFFVRVSGPVTEAGEVVEVGTEQSIYSGGDIPLDIYYKNTGNVYLVPYGIATITNMTGSVVDQVEIPPWFALPGATRFRSVDWESGLFRLGKYTADFEINRGYGDIVDEESLTLWVIPWKFALGLFGAIVVLVVLFRWLHKHIKIRVK